MVAPVISGSQKMIFWNLNGNVGPGSPNHADDVQLVQLGYHCAATDTNFPGDVRAAFAAVVPGAPYSGGASELLTIAIRLHQKDRGGIQDGHVSPLRPGTGMYDGRHSFMLIALNNQIKDRIPNAFPRIDLHPRCPALLKAVILRSCIGN